MTTRKLLAGLVMAAVMSGSLPVYASGIPVIDAAAMAANTKQWATEARQWMDTAQHYRSQIQAYKDQLMTATGLRDIQALVAQGQSLKNDIVNLQKQGISLNDLLTSNSAPAGALDSLYNKYKDFDICDVKQAQSYINICKQETVNKAWAIEQTTEVQGQINTALNDIASLSSRIAGSKDSKESQDLANAIQAKSVQLNVLSNQWEMNMKASEQRDKLLQQKREKAFRQQQINAPLPKFGDLGS
jgi:type IV secretion system protein VirB5